MPGWPDGRKRSRSLKNKVPRGVGGFKAALVAAKWGGDEKTRNLATFRPIA